MTEIDIWEKVFEKLGLKFIEESYNREKKLRKLGI